MLQGMGSFLNLCPAPDAKVLGDICKPFGVLPSQVTKAEDWSFLYQYSRYEALASWWEAWNTMVKKPDLGISMPSDLIDYMIELHKEAQKRYGR